MNFVWIFVIPLLVCARIQQTDDDSSSDSEYPGRPSVVELRGQDGRSNLCESCDCGKHKSFLRCRYRALRSHNHQSFFLPSGYFPEQIQMSGMLLDQFDGSRFLEPYQRSGIYELDLSFNYIDKIKPGSFDHFEGLQTLNLRNNLLSNSLGYLPRSERINWFSQQSPLKSLDLSYNQLTYFPDKLSAKLPQLRRLDLSHNRRLRFLNTTYENTKFRNLDELYLENCDIAELPGEFSETITNVRHLSLAGNPLTQSWLKLDLQKLEVLDLSRTQIRHLNTCDLFSQFPRLQRLIMRNSALETVNPCSYTNNRQLMEMDFSNSSSLRQFGAETFADPNLEKLQRVNLQNCNIRTLASISLKSLNHPIEFYLNGNPWNCNDMLAWFLKNPNMRVRDTNARCHYPDSQRGKLLRDFYVPRLSTPPIRSSRPTPPRWPTYPRSWTDQYEGDQDLDVEAAKLDQWWSRYLSPHIHRLLRHPMTFFVAGAISSAVLLSLVWCGCRLCCCGLSSCFGCLKRGVQHVEWKRLGSDDKDDRDPLVVDGMSANHCSSSPLDRARQLSHMLTTRGVSRLNRKTSPVQQVSSSTNDQTPDSCDGESESIISTNSTVTPPSTIDSASCHLTSDHSSAAYFGTTK